MSNEESNADDDATEATFHEVFFGVPGGEQTRFSFEEFRDLTLRHRVRLLMRPGKASRSSAVVRLRSSSRAARAI